MLYFIKQQGLKFQMVFWMTLISIISFSVLFGVNFGFYKSRLLNSQWQQLQSLSELVSGSSLFDELDDYISTRKEISEVSDFFGYKSDVVEKAGLTGIYIFYQDHQTIYQFVSQAEYKNLPQENPEIPEQLYETVETVFYTGFAEKQSVIKDDLEYYYYVQPVILPLSHKFCVCCYINSLGLEIMMIRYVIFNIFSFLVVLALLDILVISAANVILIKPIISMEKMVDSFVYQVSGGYFTFSFISSHGNELTSLRNALNRLEKLVSAHNKMMDASDRYSTWLQGNIAQLDAERSSLAYELKSTQYEMLCDKEILVGNLIAWERKCIMLDHDMSNGNITFLQLAYFVLSPEMDKKSFIEGLMQKLHIDKSIPIETIFRLSETEFVVIFNIEGQYNTLVSYVSDYPVKLGGAIYVKNKTASIHDMLNKCIAQAEQN